MNQTFDTEYQRWIYGQMKATMGAFILSFEDFPERLNQIMEEVQVEIRARIVEPDQPLTQ